MTTFAFTREMEVPSGISIGALAHSCKHAPTTDARQRLYVQAMRVRRADRAMAAGTFVRLANGRKRSIKPAP